MQSFWMGLIVQQQQHQQHLQRRKSFQFGHSHFIFYVQQFKILFYYIGHSMEIEKGLAESPFEMFASKFPFTNWFHHQQNCFWLSCQFCDWNFRFPCFVDFSTLTLFTFERFHLAWRHFIAVNCIFACSTEHNFERKFHPINK